MMANKLNARVPAAVALLLLALGCVAELGAQPLYKRFRPLTELPWKDDAAANMDAVLERIYREPDGWVRHAVLEEYLRALPPGELGRAFDACVRLEEADSPDEMLAMFMRVWAERDPTAAWARCERLFAITVEGIPFGFDQWERKIEVRPQDAAAVAASTFWPSSRDFVHGFREGLELSAVSPEEKKRLTDLSWTRDEERFGRLREPHATKPEVIKERQEARERARAEQQDYIRILATPVSALPALIIRDIAPEEAWKMTRGLIRWLHAEPQKGEEILNHVLAAYDPKGIYRHDAPPGLITEQFFLEWAIVDTRGFANWAEERAPLAWLEVQGVYVAFLNLPPGERIFRLEQADHDLKRILSIWAGIDPAVALPAIWNSGEHRGLTLESYGDIASAAAAAHRPANAFRTAIREINSFDVPVPDLNMFQIMEIWGDVDAGDAAAFGVHWLLRTKLFSKDELIRQWTGYADGANTSMSERTLTCLRTWAVTRPAEMREWIGKQPFDPEIRDALLWLVDNAIGGFPLRGGPAPAQPDRRLEKDPPLPQ